MSLNRVAAVIAAFVLCSVLFSKTQQTPSTQTGAFQMVPSEYSVSAKGANWEQHTVFLLDSKSGQVWEYNAAHYDSDGKMREGAFLSVKRID
jgi:hypothetical protein